MKVRILPLMALLTNSSAGATSFAIAKKLPGYPIARKMSNLIGPGFLLLDKSIIGDRG